jgi:hypothetical protein
MNALLFIAVRLCVDLLAALLSPSRITNEAWFEAFIKLGKRIGLQPSQFNRACSVKRPVEQAIEDAAANVRNCVQQVLKKRDNFFT